MGCPRIVHPSGEKAMSIARRFAAGLLAAPLLASTAHAVPVTLQNPTATFHQGNFGSVDQTVDGNTATGGMGFFNNRTGNTTIVYETAGDLAAGELLTLDLFQNLGVGHTLQKFRVSVTDADRSLFADGNPAPGSEAPAGDVDPTPGSFTVLRPTFGTTTGGSTVTVDDSGFISITGANPATSRYTLQFLNEVSQTTGLRIEVAPGTNGFVGRSSGAPHNSNGNAVITELTLDTAPAGTFNVGLQNATASFSQNFNATTGAVALAIDANPASGWSIFRGSGDASQAENAVFETLADIGNASATQLNFQLDFLSQFSQHVLGRFRLYATTDDRSTFADGLGTGGDVTANWTLLDDYLSFSTANGSTLIPQGDGSFLLSGLNPAQERLSVSLLTTLKNITGFRLEAMTDPSFPTSGPGRSANGNFVLTNFAVSASLIPEPASATLACAAGLALIVRRRRA